MEVYILGILCALSLAVVAYTVLTTRQANRDFIQALKDTAEDAAHQMDSVLQVSHSQVVKMVELAMIEQQERRTYLSLAERTQNQRLEQLAQQQTTTTPLPVQEADEDEEGNVRMYEDYEVGNRRRIEMGDG